MKLPPEIFRTYDIRGVVGKSLTPAIVHDIGRALGSLGRERNAATFAVCRDGRLSGPALAAALTEGLNAAGAVAMNVNARINVAKARRLTILVFMDHSSCPNFGSDRRIALLLSICIRGAASI